MSSPQVTAVTEASPAARAGLRAGDELVSLNGRVPRDVIEYQQLVDDELLAVVVRRAEPGGQRAVSLQITKRATEPLGVAVSSAVFDRVRTCDNHCAFCFIHQLPKGMRRSLYLKDDDYRLSFLYGNFTTLTRFTELDAERVLDERLSPLFVSIHATDPEVRARMLRNPRGATSLRWLRVLLDGGIEVHGQIVVCPGVNNGPVLEDTLVTVLDRYPELASLGIVPLGISRFTREAELRPHTRDEAAAVCETVAQFQEIFAATLGRRLAFAADEYYLMAGRELPPSASYEGFPQHENGIGMARAFERAFNGDDDAAMGVRPGFFAWVEGAPAAGYRAVRHHDTPGVAVGSPRSGGGRARGSGPAGSSAAAHVAEAGRGGDPAGRRAVVILTGTYGAQVLGPLVAGRPGVRVLPVHNDYFGGNTGVTGLLTGTDVGRALAAEPEGGVYLLPDACLSEGKFLDDLAVADLPRPVEVVPSDGRSLRVALERLGA